MQTHEIVTVLFKGFGVFKVQVKCQTAKPSETESDRLTEGTELKRDSSKRVTS